MENDGMKLPAQSFCADVNVRGDLELLYTMHLGCNFMWCDTYGLTCCGS